MIIPEPLRHKLLVPHHKPIKLSDYGTGWEVTENLKDLGKDEAKALAKKIQEESLESLTAAQELLYATSAKAVLIVLQAMDAAGKDGTIKHVMSGVNPQGCEVHAFKVPTPEERAHNFLWRYTRALPERGIIGIFNRSYYEDVLVVKVHPELLGTASGKGKKEFWQKRYKDINAFERHLTRNDTLILKFFLHVSKDEQKKRLLSRLDEPEKHWKFSAGDLAERAYWDDYQQAFEECLAETSTKWAPWHIIPADQKWATRALVSGLVTDAISGLGFHFPKLTETKRQEMEKARTQLEAE